MNSVSVDLTLRPELGARYTNRSQVARVVSEDWAARELYCPACDKDRLNARIAGTKVEDFLCPGCDARFQVKAKGGQYGFKVANSAYAPKIAAIETGAVPNYVFLSYDPAAWTVTSGFVVPGHFISTTVIERRPPLAPWARRAGWVGSNILLGLLPPDARIPLIEDGLATEPAHVRRAWRRFEFMRAEGSNKRGWLGDVLRSIRNLGRSEFHLSDLYQQEEDFRRLHPENRHILPKIRQQVQVLRDHGILSPMGKGRYRAIGPP